MKAQPLYAAQWGFCGEELIEDCKTETHDLLIAALGDRRTGAVSWFVWDVVEAILACAQTGVTIPPDIDALMMQHPGGRVVLAIAEARL